MTSDLFRVAVFSIVAGLASSPATHAQILPAFQSVATASGNYSYDSVIEQGSLSESKTSRLGGPIGVQGGARGLEYDARATAMPGTLSAFAATGFQSGTGGYSYANANASANAIDYFVIAGGDGLASVGITAGIHGSQSAGDGLFSSGGSDYSFYLSYAPVDPSTCYFDPVGCTPADSMQSIVSESRNLYSGSSRPIRFNNEYETDFLFRYGQPFQLNATLNTGARNGGRTDLQSTAEFSLQLPEGAYLTSASGYGYIAAVPEPGTYALLLLGLAGLALDHRRRAQYKR